MNPQGTIALGVNDEGHLITAVGGVSANGGDGTGIETGLAFRFPDELFYDATSPGCSCEGWGVAVNGAESGSANADDGVEGLDLLSFSATATTATSRVALSLVPGLTIEHAYAPAPNAPDRLFRGRVTIRNASGADVSALQYVRVMDWDVPPTEFNERLTVAGVATTSLLARSHNGGFSSADPLVEDVPIDVATIDTDFTDFVSTTIPPNSDHGAYFRFDFGALADGDERVFDIFYGAAPNEAAALAAIADEGIELYSLGQSFADPGDGTPATFVFGFAGVGGVPAPEPSAAALVLAALAAAQIRPRLSSRRTMRSTHASTSSSCVGSTRSGSLGTS